MMCDDDARSVRCTRDDAKARVLEIEEEGLRCSLLHGGEELQNWIMILGESSSLSGQRRLIEATKAVTCDSCDESGVVRTVNFFPGRADTEVALSHI